MSQIAYRKARLDGHIQRFADNPGDERIERQCLEAILLDCAFLMIPPSDIISVKAQKQANLLHAMSTATSGARIDSIESDGKVSFPCPECDRKFDSRQARGAHSKFCKKGGEHGQ